MPIVIARTRAGTIRTIDTQVNQSVMEALRDNGVDDIEALCGGSCACATCHVYVDAKFTDRLPPMSAGENDLLDATDSRRIGSRLSCQIPFTAELDGLEVEVAPAM
jgi:2Fe-2S ferredoxin